jgi:hypothetical protein
LDDVFSQMDTLHPSIQYGDSNVLHGSFYIREEPQYRRDTLAFIQCITKILESSKSYTRKIYIGNIGAYQCLTSIIVLR